MKISDKKNFASLFLLLFPIVLIFMLYIKTLSEKNNLIVKLEKIQEYGKPNGNEEEILGLITSFDLDKNEQIYVADDAFKVVRKYSKNGKFIRNFGNGPGKGPGEFNAIHEICVDSLGNLYVLDKINLNINIFDSLNNLLNSLKVPFLPAQISPVFPMLVDIVGFPFSYEGKLIHRYNLRNKNLMEPEFTYLERPKGEDAENVLKSGNSGRLRRSRSGDIYYSFFYPYVIKKYSPDGKLLKVIQGERVLQKPFININTGRIESPSGLKELVILPDDILLILVYETFGKEIRQYFDFIDGKDGKYIGTIACKDLDLNFVRFIRADFEGNIYLDFINPYPHIIKYKLTLEQK